MEANIKLKSSELNNQLLKQIKRFSGEGDSEITINIKKASRVPKRETRVQMRARIDAAIKDVENRRGTISFTLPEFERFSSLLSKTS